MVGLAYIFRQEPGFAPLTRIVNKAITKGEYFNSKPPFGTIHDDAWLDTLFMNVTVDGLIFNGVTPGILKIVFDYKLGLVGEDLPYVIQATNGGKISTP